MKNALIVSFCLLLITACGWHLRGTQPLPVDLQTLYLQTSDPYSDLSKSLRRGLKAAGVTLVPAADDAPYTLSILGQDTNRRTISTTERGKVAEYELTVQLRYSIKAGAKTVLGPDAIDTTRVYVFDENNVASTYEEEQLLISEIQRDLVQQLIRRYQSLSASKDSEAGNES